MTMKHIAKRHRRLFQRKWKTDPGDSTTKTNLCAQTLKYNELISAKKTTYNNKQVTDNSENSKNVFKLVGKMLNDKN